MDSLTNSFAGGKMARCGTRPSPYARVPTNTNVATSAAAVVGGWFARSMLEPVLRYLVLGSSKLYDSLFTRNASSSHKDINKHSGSAATDINQDCGEQASPKPVPNPLESFVDKDQKPDQRENLARLEQALLARKAITWDEYNRWFKELESEIVEEDNADHANMCAEKTYGSSNWGGSNLAMDSKVPHDNAVLVDVAKAYMGTMDARPLSMSHSKLRLIGEVIRYAKTDIELYSASKPPYVSVASMAKSHIKPAPKHAANGKLGLPISERGPMAGSSTSWLPDIFRKKSAPPSKQTPFEKLMLRDKPVNIKVKRQNSNMNDAGHDGSPRRVRQKLDWMVPCKSSTTCSSSGAPSTTPDILSAVSNQPLGSCPAPPVPSTSSLYTKSQSASIANASGISFDVSFPPMPFKMHDSSTVSSATMFPAPAPAAKSSTSNVYMGTSTLNPIGTGIALATPFSFGSSNAQLNRSSIPCGLFVSTSKPTAGSSPFGACSQMAAGTNLLRPAASQPVSGTGMLVSTLQSDASNNLCGSSSHLVPGTGLLGTGLFGSSSQPTVAANLYNAHTAINTIDTGSTCSGVSSVPSFFDSSQATNTDYGGYKMLLNPLKREPQFDDIAGHPSTRKA